MRVLSQPKAEVVGALRRSGQQAAQHQANYLESLPQDTLGEAIYETQLDRRKLIRKQHLALGAGCLAMAGLAVDFTLVPEARSGLRTALSLITMLGGAALLVTGGVTGDQISQNRSVQRYLTDIARNLAPTMADPKTQVGLMKAVENDQGEFVKDDLIKVLQQAEEHLEQQPKSDGIEGALKQVQSDISSLEKASGETLKEVRQNCQRRLKIRGKVQQGFVWGFIASPIATIAMAGMGLGAVGIAAMGATAVGALMVDHLHGDHVLTDTLDRWQLQLESARDMAQELGPAVDENSLEFGEDYLDINGIQVPVQTQ